MKVLPNHRYALMLMLAATLMLLAYFTLFTGKAEGQSVTADAYGGRGAVVSQVQRGDELPFTGFDLGLLAAGGVVLLASGVALRKARL